MIANHAKGLCTEDASVKGLVKSTSFGRGGWLGQVFEQEGFCCCDS